MSSSWKSFSHVHCRANLPNICLWDALQVASLPQIENKQEGGKNSRIVLVVAAQAVAVSQGQT